MGGTIEWDIRRDGRAWGADELAQRRARTPEKFEVIGGRLLWSDDELIAMLGMLLEQAGADRAVALGDATVWQAAVRAREGTRVPLRPLWKEVLFGPVEPALVVFVAAMTVMWIVVVLPIAILPIEIPDCAMWMLGFGGLGLSIYSLFKMTSR